MTDKKIEEKIEFILDEHTYDDEDSNGRFVLVLRDREKVIKDIKSLIDEAVKVRDKEIDDRIANMATLGEFKSVKDFSYFIREWISKTN